MSLQDDLKNFHSNEDTSPKQSDTELLKQRVQKLEQQTATYTKAIKNILETMQAFSEALSNVTNSPDIECLVTRCYNDCAVTLGELLANQQSILESPNPASSTVETSDDNVL